MNQTVDLQSGTLLLIWLFRLSHFFIFFWFCFLSLYIWLCVLCASLWFCKLCILIVMFMYSYCYACSVLCIVSLCCSVYCFYGYLMSETSWQEGTNQARKDGWRTHLCSCRSDKAVCSGALWWYVTHSWVSHLSRLFGELTPYDVAKQPVVIVVKRLA